MHRWAIAILLSFTAYAFAADEHGHTEKPHATPAAHTESPAAHAESDAHPHPALSVDPIWAGSVVILIAGMFLAAMVIGPSVRANAPEEPPVDAHGHDDHAHGHDAHGHNDSHGHAGHH